MELDELKRTLAASENQLNERIIASTNLEITAAEERGRQAGLGEKEAGLKVLEETLNASCLLPLTQNRGLPFDYQAHWGERLRKAEDARRNLEKELEMERSTCHVRDSYPGYTSPCLYTSQFPAC
jgi:hypothetical protein